MYLTVWEIYCFLKKHCHGAESVEQPLLIALFIWFIDRII